MRNFTKKLIYVLLICQLMFLASFSTVTYASEEHSEVDLLFKETFNGVKKVVTLGTENGVKPYFFKVEDSLEVGVSESKNTANAVEKGLQVAIDDTRKLIEKLPGDLLNYKETFSSILDNYQHPIFERIVYIIEENKKLPKQSDVILGRIIIKDLPDVYKAPYSVALDEIQSNIFIEAKKLVEEAEKARTQESIDKAMKMIEEVKAIPKEFSNEDIGKFVNGLENRLTPLKSVLNLDKIVSMPYKEVTPDNLNVELPGAIPKGYTLYCTFQWINDYSNGKPTLQTLKASYLSAKVAGDDKIDSISLPLFYNGVTKESLPVQSNYLIYIVNDRTSKVEYISKNPIRLSLGVDSTTYDTNDGLTSPSTTLKVKSGAAYTGYITHEIIGENKNIHIKENVLITAGDSSKDIALKIKNAVDKLSSTYLPNTEATVIDNDFTIKSWESSKISQRLH